MLDYKPNIVLANQEFKVVGTRPIRHDGAESPAAPTMEPTSIFPACCMEKSCEAPTPTHV